MRMIANVAFSVNLSISNLIFTTVVSTVGFLFFNFFSIHAAVIVVGFVASKAFMLAANCNN